MAKEKAVAKAAEEEKEEETAKEGGEGETAPEGEGAAEASVENKPFWKKKKFIIIAGAGLILLLGGGGAALYFMGIIGPHKTEAATADAPETAHAAKRNDKDHKHVFYDLGDLMVNLSGEGKRPNFLKLKISIELDEDTDKPALEQVKPRILDDFQTYLRELRVDDLKGSAGIYRLREELLLRVTEAAHPARVRDVLITEMLVQ